MSAEKRPNDDPGPSNGEPQAKRQAKGEDEMVFYPNYGIPEGDLPSDAAILESNDGFHFYCPLRDLARNSSFFNDLLSLGLVSDTTTAKTKSPIGTSLPIIPLPRVSSVALGLIISTFSYNSKPDVVDKAAVVKDMRAIITAAE